MDEEYHDSYSNDGFQQFIIPEKIFKDLQNLTEEKNFNKIIIQALQMYYTILKLEAEGHKLGMVPIHLDESFDFKRPIIFINENFGIKEDEK